MGSSTSSTKRVSPGSQPTVEIVVRRCVMPRSGSRRAAARTLSRLSIGSPIPMKTAWSTASTRRKWSAWSRISHGVRLRPNAIAPVAQNVQVSGHPDCEDRQSERRPSRYRIRTASTGCPSCVRNSVFTVPSRDSRCVSTTNVENGTSAARVSRRRAGRFVIASYPAAPRAVHSHTWAPR